MVIAFHANCVAVEDMGDFWLVGFADEKFATRQYLTLQRSYEDDDQDLELGMDIYHVERDGQAYSCYGGIECFELHSNHAVVTFTTNGAKHLKTERIEITFDVDTDEFRKLARQLERVFAGSDCLAIKA